MERSKRQKHLEYYQQQRYAFDDTFPPPQFFTFPPHFSTFSLETPLFFPISVTAALTKNLTYLNTLGRHTLNAAARFMTYPKL